MQASQKHQKAAGLHMFYPQSQQELQPLCSPRIQILHEKALSDSSSQGTIVSFQASKEEFFTLESSTTSGGFQVYDSPSVSFSPSRSPFSPKGSQSCLSDPRHSPDNMYGSPQTGSSSCASEDVTIQNKLRELEISLLGNFLNATDTDVSSFRCRNVSYQQDFASAKTWNWDKLLGMTPQLDIKEVLIECAQAISDGDVATAFGFMDVLDQMVSVSGEPIQRLGAYMLEGLRARLKCSGSNIYKALKCNEPTGKELMSYMGILYEICPYWKFAYTSANAIIKEAMANESRIHIIDFQIAQGTQYVFLIQELANRPGGPPMLRITGIDDSQSNYARGGGLKLVGEKLSQIAQSCNVPFMFDDATMSGCEYEHLRAEPGYAVAVNFPYVLHHMADESVSVCNHRDRLLRLVKSLSPKIVTLIEQESNTNTSPFLSRFVETLDYYTAMFESIDVARPRDDKQRISAEQHCVARDIVNMIACEDAERVERHELHGKWRSRFMMAGFAPCPLSSSVTFAVKNMLKGYDKNYRLVGKDGALYLGWKTRAMVTCSAWRCEIRNDCFQSGISLDQFGL